MANQVEMCQECGQRPAAVNVNLGAFVAGRTGPLSRACLDCARTLVEGSAYGCIESPCCTNGAGFEGDGKGLGTFVDRDNRRLTVVRVLDWPLGVGSSFRRQGYVPVVMP